MKIVIFVLCVAVACVVNHALGITGIGSFITGGFAGMISVVISKQLEA